MDSQGNVYLDLYCQGGSLPLGYNHDHMINGISNTAFDEYLLQKPVVQRYPPLDHYDNIRRIMSKLEPEGMTEIVLTGTSGAHALEVAIRNAVLMFNKGSNVTIMTFDGASNGRTLGTLGLSQEPRLLERLPSIETVSVPLPRAKLPVSEHEAENEESESKALQNIKSILESKIKDKPVAAIVVEPIQNRGNHFATFNFYKNLRKLAKSYGSYFIINETHTGCGATGKFWASELWGAKDPGDFLVFGKKCQVAGYFTRPENRPRQGHELTDNWNDVGWRMLQLDAIQTGIVRRKLLAKTSDTGAYLRVELQRIAESRKFIANVRGQGTFIGFDIVRKGSENVRLIKFLRDKQINVKLCDEYTVGLRPALVLEPIHASFLLKALREYPYKETLQPLS